MSKCVLFCFLLSLSGTVLGQVSFTTKSPKIAMVSFSTQNIPIDFMNRAKRLRYNYVLVQFQPNVDTVTLRKAFQRVDSCGMRLLPSFECTSRWSVSWKDDYPKIKQFNIMKPWVNPSDGQTYRYACNAWAPDTENRDTTFDFYFDSTMGRVKTAFKNAKPRLAPFPDTLEYIHIGHDEAIDMVKNWATLLIGYGDASHAKIDSVWIASKLNAHQKDTALVFRMLIAREIYTRVAQIKKKIYPSTKTLIWADIWDPQFYGGVRLKTCLGTTVQVAPNISNPSDTTDIIDLPGLTKPEKDTVNKYLIPIPYAQAFNGYDGGYYPNDCYKYFNGSKMKVICDGCLVGDASHWYTFPAQSAGIARNVSAARCYKSCVVGYCVQNWIDWDPTKPSTQQDVTYCSLEYMWRAFYLGANRMINRVF